VNPHTSLREGLDEIRHLRPLDPHVDAVIADLGLVPNISRERVRQIEVRAFEKVQEAVQKDALERAKALRVVEA